MLAGKTKSSRVTVIERAEGACRRVRHELHIPAGRNFLKTGEGAFLRKPSLQFAGVRRIKSPLAIPGNHTRQEHAPIRGRLAGKAQRLEWNLNQYHVAMAGDFGRGIPDSVPGIIRALALGVQSILLDAIGIDIEHIGVAAVVEGIEPQAYLVVVVNQLAAQHAGTYLLRLSIERQKNGIEILVGVT